MVYPSIRFATLHDTSWSLSQHFRRGTEHFLNFSFIRLSTLKSILLIMASVYSQHLFEISVTERYQFQVYTVIITPSVPDAICTCAVFIAFVHVPLNWPHHWSLNHVWCEGGVAWPRAADRCRVKSWRCGHGCEATNQNLKVIQILCPSYESLLSGVGNSKYEALSEFLNWSFIIIFL